MAVVVIAGSGRNVGKSAVVCSLIRCLPEFCWTAVKISPHAHFSASDVFEEFDASSPADTGRYLAAGAQRAYLAAGLHGRQLAAYKGLSTADGGCPRPGLIFESNQVDLDEVLATCESGLCLAVLGGLVHDWKPSLMGRALTADALVLTSGFTCDLLPAPLRKKRTFQLAIGTWQSPELARFVRSKILRTQTQR